MKTLKKTLSIILSILTLLQVGLVSASAITIEATEISLVDLSDIPDVISVQEVREKGFVERMRDEETLSSVVYRDADGTRTAYYFSMPIKYVDEAGEIKDKSNRLSTSVSKAGYGSDQYSFANTANNFKTFFPKTLNNSTPVSVEYQGRQLTMSPISARITTGSEISTASTNTFRISAVESSVNKLTDTSAETGMMTDYAVYNGVFGEKTSVRYTPMYNGVKEDIILTENTGVNTFVFELDLGGLIPEVNGAGYALLDPEIGEPVAYINPIVMIDSAGNRSTSENNTMQLTRLLGTSYQLTVTVDDEFLDDSDTVYPVYIDPSITTPSNVISDATIFNSSAAADYSGEAFTLVGNSSLYTTMSSAAGRSLVKFYNMVRDYKYSWEDVTINKIEYFVRDISGGVGDGTTVSVHMLTASTPNTLVGATGLNYWNSYQSTAISTKTIGTHGTGRNGTGTGDWYGFNISNAFLSWTNGNYGGIGYHYGLMLKASNETSTGVVFASAEYGNAAYMPFLRFSFTVSGMETEGIVSGASYRLKNTTSGQSMIFSTLTANAPAKQGTYTSGTNYADMKFVYQGNGEYTIYSADNPSLVLSVGESIGDVYNSHPVGLYPNYNDAKQRWFIVLGDASNETEDTSDTETYYFICKAYPGLVLCNNGSASSGAQLYVSENGNGIYWNIPYDMQLDVESIQQISRSACGAACCLMIYKYFTGDMLNETAFFNAAKARGCTNNGIPLLGSYEAQLEEELGDNSLTHIQAEYECNDKQYLDKICNSLRQGYPVMVLITTEADDPTVDLETAFGYSTDGHYIVVTGISSNNGVITFHYNDPHYSFTSIEGENRTISLSLLRHANNSSNKHGWIIYHP